MPLDASLAGRAVYLELLPFSRRERSGCIESPPALLEFWRTGNWPVADCADSIDLREILLGGMPAVILGQVRRPSVWFSGFEQTYLERDVRQFSRLPDLVPFRRLLRRVALRTGQTANSSSLARDAQSTAATVGRHLSILEASHVIRQLPPFLGNRASRLIKSPKLFMTDSGLAAHLAAIRDPEAAASDPMRGPLLETFVVQNFAAILGACWPQARLHFWHVQGRHEVDLVLEIGRDSLAIEVKSTARWSDRDLASLRIFLEATPCCRAGILAYNGTQTAYLGDKLWAVPLTRLLS